MTGTGTLSDGVPWAVGMMRETPDGARGTQIHVLCQYRGELNFQREPGAYAVQAQWGIEIQSRDAVRGYQPQWFTFVRLVSVRFQLLGSWENLQAQIPQVQVGCYSPKQTE